jgi:hypothetical protein
MPPPIKARRKRRSDEQQLNESFPEASLQPAIHGTVDEDRQLTLLPFFFFTFFAFYWFVVPVVPADESCRHQEK